MSGLTGKRRAAELTDADKTEASGATAALVSRTGLLPLGRTVRATGCGAGALITQQSFLPFGVGEVGVCLQQTCCWGMGTAKQTTTGAMTRSISTALTARKCIDLIIRNNTTAKFRTVVGDRRHKYLSGRKWTGAGKRVTTWRRCARRPSVSEMHAHRIRCGECIPRWHRWSCVSRGYGLPEEKCPRNKGAARSE